jgi:hypothetical protein
MSSQKNEAMNRSIMRYAPKEKTYCRTMALTSRINIAIGVDSVGHALFYQRLFKRMGFKCTEFTFSGLRRMFRKKEYGRMYSGLKKTKLQRRLKARTKMSEGVSKMELDVEEGRAYSSGIGVEGDIEEDTDGQPRANKRAKKAKDNNTLTGCRCGSLEHQRVSSKKCPFKGMSNKEIDKRIKEMNLTRQTGSTETVSGEPTEESVQSTSKYLAPEV